MQYVVHSHHTPEKTAQLVSQALAGMSKAVMTGTVLAFSQGKNAKGQPLHVPRRPDRGDGGGKPDVGGLGLKSLLRQAGKGGFGVGGPGIDTGTLFAALSRRQWAEIDSDSALIDPDIDLAGVRPDGIPLVDYYHQYVKDYAHGSITGLSGEIATRIVNELNRQLSTGA